MINKIITGFVLLLFILPVVMATPEFTFQRDETVDLKIPAYKSDNSPADGTVTCTITIRSPTEELLIQEQGMTFNTGGIYNYTVPSTNLTANGEYPTNVNCDDNSDFGFASFTFEINPSGTSYIPGITGPLLFGGILGLIFISTLLFIFAIRIELIPAKVFLMILSAIFAILNIGFIVGSFQEFLSSNSTLTTAFSAFYVVFVILMTGASIFLLIWLLIVGFRLYQIKRGLFADGS